MKGLSVSVYRCDLGDCTNKGVTSPSPEKRQYVLFDTALRHGNYTLQECIDRPSVACLKVVRRSMGRDGQYLHVEPMDVSDRANEIGPMFGGNFVYSSDSRFRELSPYPLPVHDRFETRSQYEALSR